MRSAKNGSLAKYVLASLTAAIGFGATTSQAVAATASAHAYDLSVNVNIIGLDSLNVTPQAEVQFPAQAAAFEGSDNVLDLHDVSVLSLIGLDTGELSAAVEWIPGAAFSIVGSESSVSELDLGAVGLLGANLLDLRANLVKATALVSGYCPPGALPRPFGVASLHSQVDDWVFVHGFDMQNLRDGGGIDVSEGITLSVTGNPLLNIPTNPPPNTTLNLLGIATLVLNERNLSGDGITDRGVSVNALHLTVNVIGLITANVVVAHSDVAISCD